MFEMIRESEFAVWNNTQIFSGCKKIKRIVIKLQFRLALSNLLGEIISYSFFFLLIDTFVLNKPMTEFWQLSFGFVNNIFIVTIWQLYVNIICKKEHSRHGVILLVIHLCKLRKKAYENSTLWTSKINSTKIQTQTYTVAIMLSFVLFSDTYVLRTGPNPYPESIHSLRQKSVAVSTGKKKLCSTFKINHNSRAITSRRKGRYQRIQHKKKPIY